jgi:hypothetical protein
MGTHTTRFEPGVGRFTRLRNIGRKPDRLSTTRSRSAEVCYKAVETLNRVGCEQQNLGIRAETTWFLLLFPSRPEEPAVETSRCSLCGSIGKS